MGHPVCNENYQAFTKLQNAPKVYKAFENAKKFDIVLAILSDLVMYSKDDMSMRNDRAVYANHAAEFIHLNTVRFAIKYYH